jgi:hypothetical protein
LFLRPAPVRLMRTCGGGAGLPHQFRSAVPCGSPVPLPVRLRRHRLWQAVVRRHISCTCLRSIPSGYRTTDGYEPLLGKTRHARRNGLLIRMSQVRALPGEPTICLLAVELGTASSSQCDPSRRRASRVAREGMPALHSSDPSGASTITTYADSAHAATAHSSNAARADARLTKRADGRKRESSADHIRGAP